MRFCCLEVVKGGGIPRVLDDAMYSSTGEVDRNRMESYEGYSRISNCKRRKAIKVPRYHGDS